MVNQQVMCSQEAALGFAQPRQVRTLFWTNARVHSSRAFNLDTKKACWLQEQCQEESLGNRDGLYWMNLGTKLKNDALSQD